MRSMAAADGSDGSVPLGSGPPSLADQLLLRMTTALAAVITPARETALHVGGGAPADDALLAPSTPSRENA